MPPLREKTLMTSNVLATPSISRWKSVKMMVGNGGQAPALQLFRNYRKQ
jgi:hypothetical protein